MDREKYSKEQKDIEVLLSKIVMYVCDFESNFRRLSCGMKVDTTKAFKTLAFVRAIHQIAEINGVDPDRLEDFYYSYSNSRIRRDMDGIKHEAEAS